VNFPPLLLCTPAIVTQQALPSELSSLLQALEGLAGRQPRWTREVVTLISGIHLPRVPLERMLFDPDHHEVTKHCESLPLAKPDDGESDKKDQKYKGLHMDTFLSHKLRWPANWTDPSLSSIFKATRHLPDRLQEIVYLHTVLGRYSATTQ
jgi:hypothetical protein